MPNCALPNSHEHEQACCPDCPCPHAEISRLSTPEDPVEMRVEEAARTVAATCPELDADRLRQCFGRMFEITADCRLFHRFHAAYETERRSLERL